MADAVHVIITGRVQGVGFRHWTRAQAARLGLTGWVRNRLDGSVEAVFSGDPDAIQDMLRRCREGPPSSRVAAVTPAPCADPGLAGFDARPTA